MHICRDFHRRFVLELISTYYVLDIEHFMKFVDTRNPYEKLKNFLRSWLSKFIAA
jgi:hypothetical protein